MPSCWGLGLRPAHFSDYQDLQIVPPLEVMTDNLIHHQGGPALHHTLEITSRAPFIMMHGIGLNIGGTNALNTNYLNGMRDLVQILCPKVISDHLCFTQSSGRQTYELLPVLKNKTSMEHIIRRVDQVQQFLGRQICLENVSSYIEYVDDCIPEGDFLNLIAEGTGCGVLLDVNNVFVSSTNFFLDPTAELKRYNLHHVKQIHIAGHSVRDDFLFDTHDTPVCESVWELLSSIVKNTNNIPIILENDNADTSLKTLLDELNSASERFQHD